MTVNGNMTDTTALNGSHINNIFTSFTNTTSNFLEDDSSDNPFIYPIAISLTVLVIVGIITCITVFGNLMVLLAFYLESSLHHASNYLVVSLASADLLIGLNSTFIFAVSQLQGHWIFGRTFCKIWFVNDWALFVVSQQGAFLIALDRYKSITSPTSYRYWCTKTKVIIALMLLWSLSYVIFIVAYVFWTFEPELPPGAKPVCGITLNSIGANLQFVSCFWIPFLLMTFLYVKIYRVSRTLNFERLRRSVYLNRLSVHFTLSSGGGRNTNTSWNPSNVYPEQIKAGECWRSGFGERDDTNLETIYPMLEAWQDVSMLRMSRKSNHSALSWLNHPKDAKIPAAIAEDLIGKTLYDVGTINVGVSESRSIAQGNRQGSSGIIGDGDKHIDINNSSYKGSTLSEHQDSSYSGQQSSLSTLAHKKGREEEGLKPKVAATFNGDSAPFPQVTYLDPASLQVSDPELLKDRGSRGSVSPVNLTEAGEAIVHASKSSTRKALRTISFILGAFFLSYLPFVMLNIYMSVSGNVDVPLPVFQFCYWMGYLNSALNPFMYAYVNPMFRKTFKTILGFNCGKTKVQEAGK